VSQPLPLQASAARWQSRAVRYTALYVVLVCLLLGLRYATRDTYPQLRELRQSVAELQLKRDHLEIEVQTLTTGPRVLAWATAQGMVPYAQARKSSAEIAALPSLPGQPLPNTAPTAPAPISPAPSDAAPSSAASAEQTSGTDPPSGASPVQLPLTPAPRLEVTTQWK
jgi:hypothetical protein